MKTHLYAFYFANLGSIACAPFFAVELYSRGIPLPLVPALLSVIPMGILLGGPVWGWVADRTGAPRSVLVGAALAAGAVNTTFALTDSPFFMVAGLFLWSVLRAAQLPIADNLTVQFLGADRSTYGQIRGFGSVGFMLVAFVGAALRAESPGAPFLIAAALSWSSALLALRLPETTRFQPKHSPWSLWRSSGLFILICLLQGATLTGFDNFWSVHTERLHLDPSFSGAGVALAALVEIVIMALGKPLLRRFGAVTMIQFAAAMEVPHWLLTATVAEPTLLVAAQALRGFGFGAFWIAGVAWLSDRAPKGLENSAQAILPVASFGLGYFLSMTLETANFWW